MTDFLRTWIRVFVYTILGFTGVGLALLAIWLIVVVIASVTGAAGALLCGAILALAVVTGLGVAAVRCWP